MKKMTLIFPDVAIDSRTTGNGMTMNPHIGGTNIANNGIKNIQPCRRQ